MYPEIGMKLWNSYVTKSFIRVLDISAETSSLAVLMPVKSLLLETLFSDTNLAEKG